MTVKPAVAFDGTSITNSGWLSEAGPDVSIVSGLSRRLREAGETRPVWDLSVGGKCLRNPADPNWANRFIVTAGRDIAKYGGAPEVICIEAGANDVTNHALTSGVYDRSYYVSPGSNNDIYYAKVALNEVVSFWRSQGSHVLVQTVNPVCDGAKTSAPQPYGLDPDGPFKPGRNVVVQGAHVPVITERIDEWNGWLRAMYGDDVVDIVYALQSDETTYADPTLMLDGLHPNVLGNRELVDAYPIQKILAH